MVSTINSAADPVAIESETVRVNLEAKIEKYAQNPNEVTQILAISGSVLSLISTSKKNISTIKKYNSDISTVEWQPDGAGFSIGLDNGLVTHNVFGQTVDEVCAIQVDGRPTRLSWKPDGKYVAISHQGKMSILDIVKCGVDSTVDYTGDVKPQWSPDGRYLVKRGTLLN